MAFEKKVRSVGHKSITYPWLRRYVVIGPYNRQFRRDLTAAALARALGAAVAGASKVRRSRSGKRPSG